MNENFSLVYKYYADTVESALNERAKLFQADSKVAEAMKYSLLGGGKRVRGVLVLASCETACGDFKAALNAACAIEMIHAYSLIHDDLPCMDNDDFRRGKPSCHKQFGETIALLAGDSLLTEAFNCIADIEDPKAAIKCCKVLSTAAGGCGMVFGQELDLDLNGAVQDEEGLLRVHANKTGRLLRAACVMGSVIGGASDDAVKAFDDYAAGIGLAFQIYDDVLDVTADEAELGKPVGSDSENDKFTFVKLHGIEGSLQIAYDVTEEAKTAIRAVVPDRSEFLCDVADWLIKRNN